MDPMLPRPSKLGRITTLLACSLLCLFATGCILDGIIGSDRSERRRDRDREGVFGEFDQCEPGQCDHDKCFDELDCPDGKCPLGSTESPKPTADSTDSASKNQANTSLCGTADCSNGQCKVTLGNPDRLNETKTGAYKCMRCRKPTVGDGWHNLVTEQGDSAIFLCERCWSATSPSERAGFLRAHMQSAGNEKSAVYDRLISAIE